MYVQSVAVSGIRLRTLKQPDLKFKQFGSEPKKYPDPNHSHFGSEP
jgi:hypothetical protein